MSEKIESRQLLGYSRPVPWEQFQKQLDDSERKVWEHIVFMARETGTPQAVMIGGLKIGIVWPSGACQSVIQTTIDRFDPSKDSFRSYWLKTISNPPKRVKPK